MSWLDRRALRVLLTVTLYGLVIALIYFSWQAIVAIIFAFFFAYLLEPLIEWLRRRVWSSQWGAIVIAYVIFAALLAALFLLLENRLAGEIGRISRLAPHWWAEIRVGTFPHPLAVKTGLAGKIERTLLRWAARHQARIEHFAGRSITYVALLAELVFWSVVVLILAIYVLKDKPRWLARLSGSTDKPRTRQRLRLMLVELDHAMSRYIWAQMLLSLLAFGVFAVVLSLMRLPFPLILGLVQAVAELIFVLGPLAAALFILSVALFSGHSLVPVLLFLIVWRVIQDYVNTPLLFGRRLQIHPLIVVLVLMVGWRVGGVIGMFLAVPIAAAFQIVWETWTVHGSPARDFIAFFEDDAA